VYDPDGHSEVGHFTADAVLTATFGGSDAASVNQDDYISGTIDNFTTMSGDAETETGKDWKIALGRGDLGDSVPAAADDTFSGTTRWSIGDETSATTNQYWAHLYTAENNGTPGMLPDALTKSPAEIGGAFRAGFGQHRMVGAFAATLRTDDDPAAE